MPKQGQIDERESYARKAALLKRALESAERMDAEDEKVEEEIGNPG